METETDVDKDPSAEGAEDDATENDQEVSGFAQKWGWTINIDRVSEITRTEWGKVEDYPVMYFLNILAFGNDRAEVKAKDRPIDVWSK